MNVYVGRFLILSLVLLSTAGCRKEDPNPELKDPIYKDLVARQQSYEKELEEAKKQLESLRTALTKAEPNTIEVKNIKKELAKAEAQRVGGEQLSRYYKIRAERRRILGRKAYKKAFAKGEEWPAPSEYSDYLVNIRLHEIKMNWNARVPKLQDRLTNREPTQTK